ncbi:MAG: glycosyltransferase family 2 protein [Magnetovibrionaceae bacterium]
MDNSSPITVTVLIPAYNEEKTLLDVLRRVNAQDIPGVTLEIIVVNDGSTDSTKELLDANPDLYAQALHKPNGGKGSAVKAGLAAATGDFVLFQDADLEYDPDDYARLMKPVVSFNADIVMGSRMTGPQYTRIFYFWHKVGNAVITGLFNVLFNMTFSDIYSCYLLYRRDLVAADGLKSMGWAQHAEILCTAVQKGKVAYEVPISYHGRSYDEGKKIRAHHILPVIGMIVKKRFLG